MDSPEVTFTLAYLVFAVCFVFTPTEFHSAGLTVQNLLSGWLGSEDAAFVPHHLRRTAATLLCHALLPLGEAPAGRFPAAPERSAGRRQLEGLGGGRATPAGPGCGGVAGVVAGSGHGSFQHGLGRSQKSPARAGLRPACLLPPPGPCRE